MSNKTLFSVDAVCEILDGAMSDEELSKKYSVTKRQIRVKRYHLASRNKITTSSEFRNFISNHKVAAAKHNHKIDNKAAAVNDKKDDKPLLKIMDKILDDFASFEAEYKRETIRNNEVALLEKLLDKNIVLLSRLVQRDLAFFTAVSEKGAKEAQDDYLAKLGFSDSDIGFYRIHRLDFETQEDAK